MQQSANGVLVKVIIITHYSAATLSFFKKKKIILFYMVTIQINMVAIQINMATIQINMVTILNVDFSPYNGHIGKKIDAYIFGTKNREKVFAPANLL